MDIICNARCDSVICGLASESIRGKGRSVKYGHCLSIRDDFVLSDEKIKDYYNDVRCVLTNMFRTGEALAYVIPTRNDSAPGVCFLILLS